MQSKCEERGYFLLLHYISQLKSHDLISENNTIILSSELSV